MVRADISAAQVAHQPSFMRLSVYKLGVGVFKNIITISAETPLIVVLNIFSERNVSAVPVVDATGIVIDVYSKSDIYVGTTEGPLVVLDDCYTLHRILPGNRRTTTWILQSSRRWKIGDLGKMCVERVISVWVLLVRA